MTSPLQTSRCFLYFSCTSDVLWGRLFLLDPNLGTHAAKFILACTPRACIPVYSVILQILVLLAFPFLWLLWGVPAMS